MTTCPSVTYQDHPTGGVPLSSDYVVGYEPPFGVGAERKYRIADLAVAISNSATLSSPFDGNRTVTRSGIPNINAGGVTIGEFLENYFFPAIPPSMLLNGYTLQELGSVITNLNITGTIAKNDDPALIELRYYIAGSLVHTNASPVNGAYGYSQAGANISSNTLVSTQVDTTNYGTQVANTTVPFAAPFYYGTSSNPSLPNNNVITLTKVVQNKSTKVITYNATGDYMYFAWPQSWGSISKVYDKNAFDNTADWTSVIRSENLILPADGVLTHPYYVARFSVASVYSGTMEFRF